MTSMQQRAELQRQIWQIANDVRGSVDGWDFKQYVLGTLFYRFISENFANYIEGGDEGINYAELENHVITDDIKDDDGPNDGKNGEFSTRANTQVRPYRGLCNGLKP